MTKLFRHTLLFSLFLGLSPFLSLQAQDDTLKVKPKSSGLESVVENYDSLPPNTLLPISLSEAEEMITKLVVEGRSTSQKKIYTAKVLRDFKLKILQDRILEEALRQSYTSEYERRIAHLEKVIYLLLATRRENNEEDLTSVINNFISEPLRRDTPVASLTPPTDTSSSTSSVTTNTIIRETTTPLQNIQNNSSSNDELSFTVPDDARIPIVQGLEKKGKSYAHFMSQVFFAQNSSSLSIKTQNTLNDVARWMKENKTATLILRGYTSPEGEIKYNNKLSQRRTEKVADYLINCGIAKERLKTIPSGMDTMKYDKNQYPQGRRVDIYPNPFNK